MSAIIFTVFGNGPTKPCQGCIDQLPDQITKYKYKTHAASGIGRHLRLYEYPELSRGVRGRRPRRPETRSEENHDTPAKGPDPSGHSYRTSGGNNQS